MPLLPSNLRLGVGRRRIMQNLGAVFGVLTTAGRPSRAMTTQENQEPDSEAAQVVDLTQTPEFAVIERDCTDREEGSATARFEDGTLLVEGTILGGDMCTTATLWQAVYDASENAVTLQIGTVKIGGVDLCAQCLTAIKYRVTIRSLPGRPQAVTVYHDGNEVA